MRTLLVLSLLILATHGTPTPILGILVPHSHWDAGWLRTLSQYKHDDVFPILDNLIDALSPLPPSALPSTLPLPVPLSAVNAIRASRTLILSEMAFLHPYLSSSRTRADGTSYPDRLKALISEGRVEIVGGGMVMEDEALPSLYARVSQRTYGHDLLAAHGLPPVRYGWQIDAFGASFLSSAIAAESGMLGGVINRIDAATKRSMISAGTLPFSWRGPGGGLWFPTFTLYDHYSSPPGFDWEAETRIGHGPYIYSENIKDVALRLAELVVKQAQGSPDSELALIPMGNDFAWKSTDGLDQMDKILAYIQINPDNHPLLDAVRISYGTLSSVFDALPPPPALPVRTESDFFPYRDKGISYWSGYYASRPLLKALVRIVETHVRASQTLASLTWPSTFLQPPGVASAWHTASYNLGVLCHHDAITGTAAAYVVADYMSLIANASSASHAITQAVLLSAAPTTATTATTAVIDLVLFNSGSTASFTPITLLVPGWTTSVLATVATPTTTSTVLDTQLSPLRPTPPPDPHEHASSWRQTLSSVHINMDHPHAIDLTAIHPTPDSEGGMRVVDISTASMGGVLPLESRTIHLTLQPTGSQQGAQAGTEECESSILELHPDISIRLGTVRLTPIPNTLWSSRARTKIEYDSPTTHLPSVEHAFIAYAHTSGGAYLFYDDYGLGLWGGLLAGYVLGWGAAVIASAHDPTRVARVLGRVGGKWGRLFWKARIRADRLPYSATTAAGAAFGAALAALVGVPLEAVLAHEMEIPVGVVLGCLLGFWIRSGSTKVFAGATAVAFAGALVWLLLAHPESHGSMNLGSSLVGTGMPVSVSVERGAVLDRAIVTYSQHFVVEWSVAHTDPDMHRMASPLLRVDASVLLTRQAELVSRFKVLGWDLRFGEREEEMPVLITDNGGWGVERVRKSFAPLAASFYPMVGYAGLHRVGSPGFVVFSAASAGVASLAPDLIEVMIDRRLAQDDNRGLEESVEDAAFVRVPLWVGFTRPGLPPSQWRATSHALSPLFVHRSTASVFASHVHDRPWFEVQNAHLLSVTPVSPISGGSGGGGSSGGGGGGDDDGQLLFRFASHVYGGRGDDDNDNDDDNDDADHGRGRGVDGGVDGGVDVVPFMASTLPNFSCTTNPTSHDASNTPPPSSSSSHRSSASSPPHPEPPLSSSRLLPSFVCKQSR